ncbi:MAG: class I SAM-dependent methyltransferase [Planctomycetes bacterium]|nr:class I SAM-dependent methyltransferase [Planctomycetota bacterium]
MKRPRSDRLPSPSEIGASYDRHYREAPFRDSTRYYDWLARKVVAHLPQNDIRPPRIVDVGCGGGYLLAALTRLRPRLSMVGVELSGEALRLARIETPKTNLLRAQGELLPLPSRTFDTVVCSGNLEHFVNPAAGAQELARVCRADGRIWTLLPNSFYSGDIWRVITTGYGPNHHQIIDRFASIHEWRDLLEAHGHEIEAIAPYNRFKWWKRLLPRNLAYHFLYRTRPAGASAP